MRDGGKKKGRGKVCYIAKTFCVDSETENDTLTCGDARKLLQGSLATSLAIVMRKVGIILQSHYLIFRIFTGNGKLREMHLESLFRLTCKFGRKEVSHGQIHAPALTFLEALYFLRDGYLITPIVYHDGHFTEITTPLYTVGSRPTNPNRQGRTFIPLCPPKINKTRVVQVGRTRPRIL